jgi:hypothetical protein
MQEVNPLRDLEFFYVNPYMPDSFIKLGLAKRDVQTIGSGRTIQGHYVLYFRISDLVEGNVHIKWKEADKFVINNNIYCKVMKTNVIRIDSVL